MSALAFLAKKSWHTKNMKNVERVWEAEQEKERERKRVAELRKEIDDERRELELRRMQEDAGLVSKSNWHNL